MEYSELKKRHFWNNDTDKKLTDEEIIKSLKFCEDCSANINIDIIDLITRQQAENENLKVENQSLRTAANSLKMHYEEAQAEIERLKKEVSVARDAYISIQDRYEHTKAESYKEFAERLNEKAQIADCFDSYNMVVGTHFIDNLLKEMVGEKE
mgnify:CR=1 FL=1